MNRFLGWMIVSVFAGLISISGSVANAGAFSSLECFNDFNEHPGVTVRFTKLLLQKPDTPQFAGAVFQNGRQTTAWLVCYLDDRPREDIDVYACVADGNKKADSNGFYITNRHYKIHDVSAAEIYQNGKRVADLNKCRKVQN